MYLEFWIFKNLSYTKGMVLGLNMWKNTAVYYVSNVNIPLHSSVLRNRHNYSETRKMNQKK